jgi:GT2 family glycosyltransferase
MKIYTIIVTYNGEKWIHNCLNSLLKSYVSTEIIIIDNKSSDKTTNIVKEEYPKVKLIETGQNLGFGKANNIGIDIAINDGADYVFLLNQDAWIESNTIDRLVDAHKHHPQFGILSPVHLSTEGVQDLRFSNYYNKSSNYDNNLLVSQFVNAACWLISKACIKNVGGFSDLFYHYGEDSNYCNRVIFHNFKIGIVDGVYCIHDRPQEKYFNYSKQLRMGKTNQLAFLANIRCPLFKLILLQFFLFFIECMSFRKEKYFQTIFISLHSLFFSFKHIKKVVSVRKITKKGRCYI